MTQSTEDRAILIKKLLNKAEAKGTTPDERDALNAKATTLMLKWGIEEALLVDVDRVKVENVIQRQFTTDAPKSYSYEYTCIGIAVAETFSCQGFLQRQRGGQVNLTVVGFESDVHRVIQIFQSLTLQCTLELGVWYRTWITDFWTVPNGTERYQAKKGFIRGYADGVGAKMRATRFQFVKESAPGTDLVLLDRRAKVDEYVSNEMKIGGGRRRQYAYDGMDAGHSAGMRADVGGGKVGGGHRELNN